MRARRVRGDDHRGFHRGLRRWRGTARPAFRHEAFPDVPGIADQSLYGGGAGAAGGGGVLNAVDCGSAGNSPVATAILRVTPLRQTVSCSTWPTFLRETSFCRSCAVAMRVPSTSRM